MANITSVTVLKRLTRGNERTAIVEIRGASSYATGGDTLTAAHQATIMGRNVTTLRLSDFHAFSSEVMGTTTPAGLVASLDRTNGKILFYRLSATAAEVTAATNLSAQPVRCAFTWAPASG